MKSFALVLNIAILLIVNLAADVRGDDVVFDINVKLGKAAEPYIVFEKDQAVFIFDGWERNKILKSSDSKGKKLRAMKRCSGEVLKGKAILGCVKLNNASRDFFIKKSADPGKRNWKFTFSRGREIGKGEELALDLSSSDEGGRITLGKGINVANQIKFKLKGGDIITAFPSDGGFVGKSQNFVDFSLLKSEGAVAIKNVSKDVMIDNISEALVLHSPYLERVAAQKREAAKTQQTYNASSAATSARIKAGEARKSSKKESNGESLQNKKTDIAKKTTKFDKNSKDLGDKKVDRSHMTDIEASNLITEKTRSGHMAKLSSREMKLWQGNKRAVLGSYGKSILNLRGREHLHGDDFTKMRNKLILRSSSDNVSDKANALFDLSILYFNAGWYAEAAAMMRVFAAENTDDLVADARVSMLHDLSHMLNMFDSFDDMPRMALNMHATPDKFSDEISFIKTVLPYAVLRTDFSHSFGEEKEKNNETMKVEKALGIYKRYEANFLSEYDDTILIKLGVGLVRLCIYEADSYSLAKSAMKTLKKILRRADSSKISIYDLSNVKYYNALLLSKGNDLEAAEKEFDACIAYNDKLLYTQCSFVKYREMFDNGLISKGRYLEHLEDIKWHWRGRDSLDTEILLSMAQRERELGLYTSAMRSWAEMALYLNDASIISRSLGEMSDIFKEFFSDENNNKFSPIHMIAFYIEFSDHLPIGRDGDNIALKVVDKLISLDLLTDAAELLRQKIQHNLLYNKKDEAINKLARIYLALRKADLAVNLIDRSGTDSNSIFGQIFYKRRAIYYASLLESKKYSVIKSDLEMLHDEIADHIMAELYWDIGSWRNFTKRNEPKINRWRSGKLSMYPAYSNNDSINPISTLYSTEEEGIDNIIANDRYSSIIDGGKSPNVDFSGLKDIIMQFELNSYSPVNTYLTTRGASTLLKQSVAYLMLNDSDSLRDLNKTFKDKLPSNEYGTFVADVLSEGTEEDEESGLREMYPAAKLREKIEKIGKFNP